LNRLSLLLITIIAASSAEANESEFTAAATTVVTKYCFDCHGGGNTEANLDLQSLLETLAIARQFKQWQRVALMLEQGKMPPEDAPQPTADERRQLAQQIRGVIQSVADQHSGDPGEVVMRRLTSAELSYTIEDLTGLQLDLTRGFVSDAVGGEGFANNGAVQFIQESTIERYLEVAKRVADHAVIGAGPLRFHGDPGTTGLELSAITRIQDLYRQHGFRAAAGEGGEAFGLEQYTRAFYTAWRFHHRHALGQPDATLADLAGEQEISVPFAQHIWSVLTDDTFALPTAAIVEEWQRLPPPDPSNQKQSTEIMAACQGIRAVLEDWQRRLARPVEQREQAALLTAESFDISSGHEFVTDIRWLEGDTDMDVFFVVNSIVRHSSEQAVVRWQQPRIRFRHPDRSWQDEQPLAKLLDDQAAQKIGFGVHPTSAVVDPLDLYMLEESSRSFTLRVPQDLRSPEGTAQAELLVRAELDLVHGGDGVLRCAISDDANPSQGKTVSALIADPEGAAFERWRDDVFEFAMLLPQVSHREPAPSDRDPIPPPFDNTYNSPERNDFHVRVKYARDDQFLVERMLDEATRARLDTAWADLLTSFDYHRVVLRYMSRKFGFDLGDVTLDEMSDEWIESLRDEARGYVHDLRSEYRAMHRARIAVEPSHVQDAIGFAARAWRRPLSDREQSRLISFYDHLRQSDQHNHTLAMRILLTRLLVAPEFLYRTERPSMGSGIVALSDRELAHRLSYFLWSSLPDETLTDVAAAGQLQTPEQLTAQALRMLQDPKARRFATEFFGQWFGFYRFDQYRGVDPQRYPEFTESLRKDMYEESIAFFEYLVRKDRPPNEILFADYTFVNQTLAEHYGLDSASLSGQLSRVERLGETGRGGLLGLGAVLTVTSAPLRTSPVKRGDWILRRVLGTPVPPPPPDAGSIPADDVLGDGRTIRERLEAHRRDPTCAGCHARIDPLGFALETFDAIGRARETYRDGQPIDTSGTLHDSTELTNAGDLRRYLATNEHIFHRNLTTKLVGYALGRSELATDAQLIESVMRDIASGVCFSEIVVRIVTSKQFRQRRGREELN
jgi:hypothetical protein